jgi:hypothetical protein
MKGEFFSEWGVERYVGAGEGYLVLRRISVMSKDDLRFGGSIALTWLRYEENEEIFMGPAL